MIADIESPRLLLRHLDPRVLRYCLAGDLTAAAELLGTPPAAHGWTNKR